PTPARRATAPSAGRFPGEPEATPSPSSSQNEAIHCARAAHPKGALMAGSSAMDEVRRLEKELDAARQAAIKELLAERREAVRAIDAQLAELGYRGGAPPPVNGAQRRRKRGPMSDEHKRKIAEGRARNKAARSKAAAKSASAQKPRL